INAAIPEHRIFRRSRVIAGERYRFHARSVSPDILVPAALVALCVTRLPYETREKKRAAIRRVTAFRRSGQRKQFMAAIQSHGYKLISGKSGVAARANEQFTARCPAFDGRVSVPRQALR